MSQQPAPLQGRSHESEVRELAPRLCSHVRSTVVVSSMQALRAAGHGARYEARLPSAARERLLSIGAPSWLPLELAWSHYATCNALNLTRDEVLAIGARVAPVHVSGAALILRAARAGGVTPWALFQQGERFWRRMYEGGSLEIYRDGPKDARLIVRSQPLTRLTYWRLGLLGILQALTGSLAQRVFVRDELGRSSDAGPPPLIYYFAWV